MQFNFQDPEAVDATLASWQSRYGLTTDQLIWNRWGLPVLPKPLSRQVHDRVVLFPDNAGLGVISHPMYWLHPSITDPHPGEDMEMWNIRVLIFLQQSSLIFEGPDGGWQWADTLSIMGVDRVDDVMRFAHLTRERTPLPTFLLYPNESFDWDAYSERFASVDAYLRANGQRLIDEWQHRRFAALHQEHQARVIEQEQERAERNARATQVAKGVGLGAALLTLDLVGAVLGGGGGGDDEPSSYVSPAERKRRRENEQIHKAAVRRARRELPWHERGLLG
ncbi:MAG: hypothetical protein ACTHLJ_09170 [Angustibacter sp.]